jgi:hypothetical protein
MLAYYPSLYVTTAGITCCSATFLLYRSGIDAAFGR